MDRLTSLEVFSRVVETGGFSAAARKLNMSTTMVSNHVQALEDRLGVRLLQRTTRKVSLTEIGKAYYDRCIQILADIEQADDIASELQSVPRGTLRIHVATHMVPFVAPVVAKLLSTYPELKIDLRMGEAEIDLIEEGYDVAVCLMAGFLIRDDLEAGHLVRLLPECRPVEMSMNAVYPHRHHLSAKVRTFIDMLVHHSAEQQKLINPYS